MLALAVNKTNSRESAEEIVQNTFVKFFQHRDSLDPDISVRAYLYVICKNQILNHHRDKLVEKRYEDYLLHYHSAQDDDMIGAIEAKELQQIINLEIENLPEKCKAVYLLSRSQYLSNREIANQLSISENTVEQHMRKALGRLRISLARYMGLAVFIFLTGK